MIPTRESDVGVLDPTDPRNCYAESKRLGEALCIAYHRQFGVAASIVRPFHVYGPGMRLTMGAYSRILPLLLCVAAILLF